MPVLQVESYARSRSRKVASVESCRENEERMSWSSRSRGSVVEQFRRNPNWKGDNAGIASRRGMSRFETIRSMILLGIGVRAMGR